MARNSKRNAFTIVELVIVIAVIAILSTVLITTFTGVIESANVSADKQLLSTLNTQISMHIGKGNDIDTVDDLKTALNTQDINYWEKLDPKSAQYGYHYWYNPVKQEIVLSTYEKLENLNVKAEPIGRFLGEVSFAPKARASEGFEAASPRTLDNGYYFLDQKSKNDNKISDFFFDIENMSLGNDYTAALSKLNLSANDKNKELADEILKKISATAIVTNKGVFINAATTEQVITNIYIPENLTGNADYYLNNKVVNNGAATVKDLAELTVTVSNITIPENIKVAEGSLTGFAGVTINVNVESGDKLADVFSASSVSATATIVTNNGVSYEINGSAVTEKGKTETVVTLTYMNPVTSFDIITGDSNVVTKTTNNYIALDTIHSGIKFELGANNFKGANDGKENYPDAYEKVRWEIAENTDNDDKNNIAGVSIDENTGVVTFDKDKFEAASFTIKATAVSNSATYKTFVVNVVRLNKVTVNFVSGSNNGSITIANGQKPYEDANNLLVTYDDDTVKANFGDAATPKYAVIGTTDNVPFTDDEIKTLGCAIRETKYTTTEKYFTIATSGGFTFTKVADLNGSKGTQAVDVVVSDAAGEAITATIIVTVNDNTNVPFKSDIPSYTNGHVYTVGNANALPLAELFAKKPGASDLSEYKIYIYDNGPSEGYFYTPVKTIENLTEDMTIEFTDDDGKKLTGPHWVVLATNADSAEKEETATFIKVNVVDKGVNVTTKDEFKTPATGESIVLHNDISGFEPNTGAILTLNGGSIYGNYFKVDASTFHGLEGATGGYSFMKMTNGSINQFVLDGPVFPVQCLMSSDYLVGTDNSAKYFCFGIEVTGTSVTINDSYISHFNSPLFVSCATLEANNTVFEGGALANIYVRTGVSELKFTDVMTVQNRNGYSSTIPGTTGTVLGMGIFVHEDQTTDLHFNFANVEQYNWLSSTDKNGFYTKMAIEAVYGKNYTSGGFIVESVTSNALAGDYSAYGHSLGETVTEGQLTGSWPSQKVQQVTREKQYINAAIAAINKKETTVFTITSKVSAEENAATKYTYKGGDGAAEGGTVWVSTYACAKNGTCCSKSKIDFVYGGWETFRSAASVGTGFSK